MSGHSVQQGDISYVLGKVEEGFNQLKQADVDLRAEITTQRTETATQFARSVTVAEQHQVSDTATFKELREANTAMMLRLQNFEGMFDMVQGHDNAILDLEKRQAGTEEIERTRTKLKSNDRKWQQIVGVLVIILFADKFTGSHVSEILPELFKAIFK